VGSAGVIEGEQRLRDFGGLGIEGAIQAGQGGFRLGAVVGGNGGRSIGGLGGGEEGRQGGEDEGDAAKEYPESDAEEHKGHAGAGDATVVGAAPVRVGRRRREEAFLRREHAFRLFPFRRDRGVE
jgi:hypothetical protein